MCYDLESMCFCLEACDLALVPLLCFSQEKPEGEMLKQTALELGKCARTSEDSAGPLFCLFQFMYVKARGAEEADVSVYFDG